MLLENNEINKFDDETFFKIFETLSNNSIDVLEAYLSMYNKFLSTPTDSELIKKFGIKDNENFIKQNLLFVIVMLGEARIRGNKFKILYNDICDKSINKLSIFISALSTHTINDNDITNILAKKSKIN